MSRDCQVRVGYPVMMVLLALGAHAYDNDELVDRAVDNLASRAMQVNDDLNKVLDDTVNDDLNKVLDDTVMAKEAKTTTTTKPPSKNPFAALFGGGDKKKKGKGKGKTVARKTVARKTVARTQLLPKGRGKTKTRALPMEDFGISRPMAPSSQVGLMGGLGPMGSRVQVRPMPMQPMPRIPQVPFQR